MVAPALVAPRLPSIRWLAAAVAVLLLSGVAGALIVGDEAVNVIPAGHAAASNTFVSWDARFSAEFPSTPHRGDLTIELGDLHLEAVGYGVTTNAEDLAVAYAELPTAPKGDGLVESLDRAVDGAALRANGVIVERTLTSYLKRPAEDAVFTTPSGAFHARVVFVDNRLYTFVAITALAGSPHPAYDRLLATFQPQP